MSHELHYFVSIDIFVDGLAVTENLVCKSDYENRNTLRRDLLIEWFGSRDESTGVWAGIDLDFSTERVFVEDVYDVPYERVKFRTITQHDYAVLKPYLRSVELRSEQAGIYEQAVHDLSNAQSN